MEDSVKPTDHWPKPLTASRCGLTWSYRDAIVVAGHDARAMKFSGSSAFQKTDVDVPEVTDWSLMDLADTGDGQLEIIQYDALRGPLASK